MTDCDRLSSETRNAFQVKKPIRIVDETEKKADAGMDRVEILDSYYISTWNLLRPELVERVEQPFQGWITDRMKLVTKYITEETDSVVRFAHTTFEELSYLVDTFILPHTVHTTEFKAHRRRCRKFLCSIIIGQRYDDHFIYSAILQKERLRKAVVEAQQTLQNDAVSNILKCLQKSPISPTKVLQCQTYYKEYSTMFSCMDDLQKKFLETYTLDKEEGTKTSKIADPEKCQLNNNDNHLRRFSLFPTSFSHLENLNMDLLLNKPFADHLCKPILEFEDVIKANGSFFRTAFSNLDHLQEKYSYDFFTSRHETVQRIAFVSQVKRRTEKAEERQYNFATLKRLFQDICAAVIISHGITLQSEGFELSSSSSEAESSDTSSESSYSSSYSSSSSEQSDADVLNLEELSVLNSLDVRGISQCQMPLLYEIVKDVLRGRDIGIAIAMLLIDDDRQADKLDITTLATAIQAAYHEKDLLDLLKCIAPKCSPFLRSVTKEVLRNANSTVRDKSDALRAATLLSTEMWDACQSLYHQQQFSASIRTCMSAEDKALLQLALSLGQKKIRAFPGYEYLRFRCGMDREKCWENA